MVYLFFPFSDLYIEFIEETVFQTLFEFEYSADLNLFFDLERKRSILIIQRVFVFNETVNLLNSLAIFELINYLHSYLGIHYY